MKRFLYLIATDQIKGGAVAAVKAILWILSQVYVFLITLRRFFYTTGIFKSHRLSIPVISIGNLTVGGVGKTPLVEFIAQALRQRDVCPVILMRGYMGEGADRQRQGSDEAKMLKGALSDVPILVGADRVKNAEAYLRQNKADVFVLDDGFQHWQLARDMDIVAIDTTNPWGNGCLLPRGILRETKNALLRANIFVLTKTDFGSEYLQDVKNDLKSINPDALMVEATHKPVLFSDIRSGEVLDLDIVRGQTICAVSSIGSPDSFKRTLLELGVDIAEHFAFMDHHVYEERDVRRIIAFCKSREMTTVLTTEKDAVKLKAFLRVFPEHIRVLSLRIKIDIVSGEDAFLERINHIS